MSCHHSINNSRVVGLAKRTIQVFLTMWEFCRFRRRLTSLCGFTLQILRKSFKIEFLRLVMYPIFDSWDWPIRYSKLNSEALNLWINSSELLRTSISSREWWSSRSDYNVAFLIYENLRFMSKQFLISCQQLFLCFQWPHCSTVSNWIILFYRYLQNILIIQN